MSSPEPYLVYHIFLSLIYHHMIAPQKIEKPCAFVLDYSHFIFGDNRNLSDAERAQLLLLAKALLDAPVPQNTVELKIKNNIIVFGILAISLAVLPCANNFRYMACCSDSSTFVWDFLWYRVKSFFSKIDFRFF